MLTGAYVALNDLVSLSTTCTPRRRSRKMAAPISGERISMLRGRGVDFEEVRQYQPGDDVRNIDWKVTARKRVPHTKIYTEERERPTLVIVDQTMSMFLGSTLRLKSVAAAEIATRIAWHALAQRDRVGGVVVGLGGIESIKPFRNGTAVVKVLRAVVEANNKLSYSQHTNTNLPAQADLWKDVRYRLRRIAPAHHRIVVVSDFIGLEKVDVEGLLNRGFHNDMQIVHVYDEMEATLPPSNLYAVTDGSMHLSFHSGRRAIRDEYARRFDEQVDSLRTMCLNRNVSFRSLSTQDDLEAFDFSR